MTSGPGPENGMERLRHEMAAPPYHHAFLRPYARSYDAETGTVRIGVAYRPEFSFSVQTDYYHGGVVAGLIDLAGHAAVAVQIGRIAPTIDLRVDYLRPVPGVELTATARVLKLGRTIARADIEVADETGMVYAVGRGTFSTT
ncbi:PaaI family thioesterase [Ancylobacter sp. MQZ15Z-1]|uniref:PaaI family thioesterase n=1 Tax=Ancylobacter mangrovi TaxID=2972472 RepID=A0A9X2PDA9_9HYPH|nr:PaaI family thioesterase [Ancylobacter mangrovi]MCS0496571.1 PaaI family thioesterase [Ancylobacter mangrovi]